MHVKFLAKMMIAGAFVFATVAQSGFAQDPYQTETFAVNDDVDIKVRTSGGSIEAIGRNSDEVRVEMYVRKRGREIDPGDADLRDWEITIEKRGNEVVAEAKREGRGWNNDNISISFVIYSPIRAAYDMNTSGGSIRMVNLSGDQGAKTSGGSITAERISGDIELKTSGGSITIEEVEGSVEANTSGGRIRAEDITGDLNVKTSGGSITLDNVSGNVDAATSGGSIDAEIVNPEDYIELRTSGGSITVSVPENLGYDIDLDGNRVRADLKNFNGEYERDEMVGTMNGGGTRLKARTSGGSVTLRYL
ncbi:MAG: DUF4097 domain-containing protein [Balneolales bacterium]|nr:DUF4097 domain-containing protein [Balneolales bacterium]